MWRWCGDRERDKENTEDTKGTEEFLNAEVAEGVERRHDADASE
jgi:hypothetical protein